MKPKTIAGAEASSASSLMVNSVQKAFRVLNAFSRENPRLTLTQIMDKLSVDKSTAQRFTHTLQVMGYLDKDPISKTFGLTVKVLDLSNAYLSSNPLVSAAMPYMVHLSVETGETVNLTVMDGNEVVFIGRILGRHLLSTGVIIGTRLPAYAAVTGLAMMSTMELTEVSRILAETDLRPYTPSTIYDTKELLAVVQQARQQGYAMTVETYYPNDISIGAPILSRTGTAVGAISLSVSLDRFTPSDAEQKFARLVSTAAKSIAQ